MSMKPLTIDDILAAGDEHYSNSLQTPIRPDAFELSDQAKKQIIAEHFRQIMHTLGLDLTDDSLSGTPERVAKMYVEEIFSGLNPANLPKVALFDNKYNYEEMLVEKNITLNSMCEHHFVPIIGKAHVGYISSGKVIGLSKINRIVRHFSRRPQVQERLTREIVQYLQEALETEDVALIIDAKHYCVAMRGIEDSSSRTVTVGFEGKFKDQATQQSFYKLLNL